MKRNETQALRRQVARLEERLRRLEPLAASAKDPDTRRLLHELQIHQTELEAQNNELTRTREEAEAALHQSQVDEARFRSLFEQSPVAMWEMDLSGAKRQLELLRRRRVRDLRAYFHARPEAARALLADTRVLSVNNAMVRLHGASSREELLAHYARLATTETRQAMLEARIALTEGLPAVQIPCVTVTMGGQRLHVILQYLILPGSETTWDRAVLAITDVTPIHDAQHALETAHRDLMHAGEAERRRIARELHDSVAQDLVALELMLDNQANGATPPGPNKAAGAAVARCKQILRDIRTICQGLYPQALETFGLAPSLRQLAASCSLAGLHTEVTVAPDIAGRRFPGDVEIAVFRIAQEAANNALRHSGASRLAIRLLGGNTPQTVVLAVTDNGKGFNRDTQTPTGLGLVSMRERAEAVGGKLTIDSHPGATTVFLGVPAEP